MSSQQNSVTVQVVGGPTVSIPFSAGMNAQQAIEGAYDSLNKQSEFTYGLQYFGARLGYLVVMINETYESFISSAHPFYFWEFFVNGQPAKAGIDQTNLNADDVIAFELKTYSPNIAAESTLHAKYKARIREA
ncbi:MAG TPA: DUF4430 domain-containing protein [Chthoniobacterales bacterium]|nr:DUF4430 domain-containing protein [Chthoniobacterales bacterium]